MTESNYTYPASHETTLYPNKQKGITVQQDCEFLLKGQIVLTLDQAEWLANKLYHLATLIRKDEIDWNDQDLADPVSETFSICVSGPDIYRKA